MNGRAMAGAAHLCVRLWGGWSSLKAAPMVTRTAGGAPCFHPKIHEALNSVWGVPCFLTWKLGLRPGFHVVSAGACRLAGDTCCLATGPVK